MCLIAVLSYMGYPYPFLSVPILAPFVSCTGLFLFLSLFPSDCSLSDVDPFFPAALAMSPSLLPDLAPSVVEPSLCFLGESFPNILVELLHVPFFGFFLRVLSVVGSAVDCFRPPYLYTMPFALVEAGEAVIDGFLFSAFSVPFDLRLCV